MDYDDDDQVDKTPNENPPKDNQNQNTVTEENLDKKKDFEEEKHEIFIELFRKIMETKVGH